MHAFAGLEKKIAITTILLSCLLACTQAKDETIISHGTTNANATIIQQGTNTERVIGDKGRFLSRTKIVTIASNELDRIIQAKKVLMKIRRNPKEGDKGPQTLEDAAELLSRSVNMACPPAKCLEHEGVFYFSGCTSAKPVDNFNSGLAIKMGETTIYEWSTDKPDEDK